MRRHLLFVGSRGFPLGRRFRAFPASCFLHIAFCSLRSESLFYLYLSFASKYIAQGGPQCKNHQKDYLELEAAPPLLC